MAEFLPLHPGVDAPAPAGPGQELRMRRDRLVTRIGRRRFEAVCEALQLEAARATLELTGAAPSSDELARARKGQLAAAPGLAAPLGALGRIAQAAPGRDPDAPLLGQVHQIATGSSDKSGFRSVQIEPQFEGAGLSPPQTIPTRLGDLLGWIGGKSGRDLETAPRAALFFGRFLEISPFPRANFRVAHLMLSFFTLADGQPPIWFELDEAGGIRSDVSRAFRFDTAPLTARIEAALERSLDRIASG